MKKLLLLLLLIPNLVMGKPHITLACEGKTVELASSSDKGVYIDNSLNNNTITIQYYDNDRLFFDSDSKLMGDWGLNKLFKDCEFGKDFIICRYKNQWENWKTDAHITIDRKSGGTKYDYSRKNDDLSWSYLVQARLNCELAEKNKF
jgi:hypothetical protein